MTRIVAMMVWAAPAVLAVSQEASLRGAKVAAAGVRRGLAVEDEFVNCFGDTRQRVMTDMLVDKDMTPDLCRSHCAGASYYATQYANECFCGYSDQQSDYEINGRATCDKTCAGDSSTICGGTWAFSLYKFSDEDSSGGGSTDPDYNVGQYGKQYEGDATYYGATAGGNCGFFGDYAGMYSDMIPIALNNGQYGDSLMCGACVEGTASGNGAGANPIPSTFKGFIMDRCPECSWGDLDFSVSGDGRWDIEWEFVACPGENISFRFEGSNDYYWKLQAQGTKTPVESLSINGKAAYRTQDNYFELEGGPWYGAQTVVTTTVAGVTQTTEVSR